jgi:hypothetical protein
MHQQSDQCKGKRRCDKIGYEINIDLFTQIHCSSFLLLPLSCKALNASF